ncbi:MAG: carbon storage regulator CsrA [Chloroflexi bacterium]|nr:carbon storage regulator CsrA [Chloroflexota bacterium]
MLILSRKADESICIQRNIVVTVLEIDGDRVKLGINAPRDVLILRQELCDEVKAGNIEAANPPTQQIEQILPSLQEWLAERKHL